MWNFSRCKLSDPRWQLQHRSGRSMSKGEILSWRHQCTTALSTRDLLQQVGWVKTLHLMYTALSYSMELYVCVCVIAVFIWQTSLAVVHVHRVTSAVVRVSLVHLACVRLDSTVSGGNTTATGKMAKTQWFNSSFVSSSYISWTK